MFDCQRASPLSINQRWINMGRSRRVRNIRQLRWQSDFPCCIRVRTHESKDAPDQNQGWLWLRPYIATPWPDWLFHMLHIRYQIISSSSCDMDVHRPILYNFHGTKGGSTRPIHPHILKHQTMEPAGLDARVMRSSFQVLHLVLFIHVPVSTTQAEFHLLALPSVLRWNHQQQTAYHSHWKENYRNEQVTQFHDMRTSAGKVSWDKQNLFETDTQFQGTSTKVRFKADNSFDPSSPSSFGCYPGWVWRLALEGRVQTIFCHLLPI